MSEEMSRWKLELKLAMLQTLIGEIRSQDDDGCFLRDEACSYDEVDDDDPVCKVCQAVRYTDTLPALSDPETSYCLLSAEIKRLEITNQYLREKLNGAGDDGYWVYRKAVDPVGGPYLGYIEWLKWRFQEAWRQATETAAQLKKAEAKVERLAVLVEQHRGALGYPIPCSIPENPDIRNGLAEAFQEQLSRLQQEVEHLYQAIPGLAVPPDQVERLADLVHEMWAGWMSWLYSHWYDVHSSGETFQNRWRRQMETPYAALSEEEKESDRQEARRILELLALPAADPREENLVNALAAWYIRWSKFTPQQLMLQEGDLLQAIKSIVETRS